VVLVSRVRQQLRRAARDFADKIYETLRTDFVRELRRELASKPSRAASATRPPRRRSSPTATAAASFERVLVYVTEHPGTSPKAIIDETGLRRPVVFQALAEGCESGALSKAGRWRNVTYAPAGYTSSEGGVVGAAPKPKYRRSRVGAADIVEDVVAWISMHDGCRRSELTTAFPVTSGVLRRALDVTKEQGRIRMEGTRASARYFALGASRSSTDDVRDGVVMSVAATR
jgi:hypothetical protein